MSATEDIQYNCNISDARDHGIYSMCTMVLKLRNLYKWENRLEPWQEPEPSVLLDWIDTKENFWEDIAESPYRDIGFNGDRFNLNSSETLNDLLRKENLVYGAGYGRAMKSVFFLAEVIDEFTVSGFPVLLLGKERAREMASPFAMVQDGKIIIRRDSLRFFLWDQIQELSSSCRSAFHRALCEYGLIKDGRPDLQKFQEKLDDIVDSELNLFIYHEIGEILQDRLDSKTMEKIVFSFPSSVIELACRTIKDVLADCHANGLLAYCIRERKVSSLSLYIGFLDGLRKIMVPEIVQAWDVFQEDGKWSGIERGRSSCLQKYSSLAGTVRDITEKIGILPDREVEKLFHRDVIAPLGLELPQD